MVGSNRLVGRNGKIGKSQTTRTGTDRVEWKSLPNPCAACYLPGASSCRAVGAVGAVVLWVLPVVVDVGVVGAVVVIDVGLSRPAWNR